MVTFAGVTRPSAPMVIVLAGTGGAAAAARLRRCRRRGRAVAAAAAAGDAAATRTAATRAATPPSARMIVTSLQSAAAAALDPSVELPRDVEADVPVVVESRRAPSGRTSCRSALPKLIWKLWPPSALLDAEAEQVLAGLVAGQPRRVLDHAVDGAAERAARAPSPSDERVLLSSTSSLGSGLVLFTQIGSA